MITTILTTVALALGAAVTTSLWANLLLWVPMLLWQGVRSLLGLGMGVEWFGAMLLSMTAGFVVPFWFGVSVLGLPWYAAGAAGTFVALTSYTVRNPATVPA